jgi:hypothetical protein
MYPLSESLFMVLMRCLILIWVALSLTDGSPRPISFIGRWTPSMKKFERRPVANRSARFSMPSISDSWRSLKIPRCVAWYLDLRSCSITRVL